jgi:hypothetical protein
VDLRFDRRLVRPLAARFVPAGDDAIVDGPARRAKENRSLGREDFLAICAWKSPRSRPRCESNSEELVRAVTAVALTTGCEQLRIESLTLLCGVGWPTASAILHFCHADPYPVLDVRALWSLGVEGSPAHTIELWSDYTAACRRLARRCRVSMRELDRALWQYSKENQGPLG